jgi:hypothetical protein
MAAPWQEQRLVCHFARNLDMGNHQWLITDQNELLLSYMEFKKGGIDIEG